MKFLLLILFSIFFTQQSTKAQDLDNSHSPTIRQLLEGSHNFEESHNVNALSPTIRQLLEDAHPLPIQQLLEPDESIPELSFGENDPDKGINNQHTSLSTIQQDNLALPDDYNPILMLPEPALENIGEGFQYQKDETLPIEVQYSRGGSCVMMPGDFFILVGSRYTPSLEGNWSTSYHVFLKKTSGRLKDSDECHNKIIQVHGKCKLIEGYIRNKKCSPSLPGFQAIKKQHL